MQQRTSTTQRRSIGRGASLLITRTLSCSGKWEGTVRVPSADLIRCERCAVGIHAACAIDYSEWFGGPGKPGRAVRQARHLRGFAALLLVFPRSSLLCS